MNKLPIFSWCCCSCYWWRIWFNKMLWSILVLENAFFWSLIAYILIDITTYSTTACIRSQRCTHYGSFNDWSNDRLIFFYFHTAIILIYKISSYKYFIYTYSKNDYFSLFLSLTGLGLALVIVFVVEIFLVNFWSFYWDLN